MLTSLGFTCSGVLGATVPRDPILCKRREQAAGVSPGRAAASAALAQRLRDVRLIDRAFLDETRP